MLVPVEEQPTRRPQVYQDYLPEELRPKTAEERHQRWQEMQQRTPPPPPRAGHGTVWVVPGAAQDWSAHWEDEQGHEGYVDVDGSLEEVRRWVDQQSPAAAFILLPTSGETVPLTGASWLEGRRQAREVARRNR